MRKISEYDAFGPWIYEINNEHPLPAMFEQYVDIKQEPELLIKVPVDKERRELKPEMQLYKYVIGLYSEQLSIIMGENNMITAENINYNDIIAVENSVDLLLGTLTLFLNGKKYTITYNTSSQNIIKKLVLIVRNKITAKDTIQTIKTDNESKVDLSHYYNNILSDFKRSDSDVKLLSYQKHHWVKRISSNFFVRLYERILKPRLLESMCLNTGKELIIQYSSDIYKMRFHPNYGSSSIFIPLKNISAASLVESERYQDILIMKISVLDQVFSVYFEKNNTTFEILMHTLQAHNDIVH